MNVRNQFNRIGHLFDDGVEKTQRAAGHWMDKQRAAGMSRQMRDRIDTGRRNIVSAEETLVRHMRENPALYLMGFALLIGVLIARLMMESRRDRQLPLL